jgi:hypothetical protein
MRACFSVVAVVGALVTATSAQARTRTEYRHFRALVIDLEGRLPTRAEIAAFERPDFALDAFLDRALAGDGYGQRIRRTYLDRLRLELPSTFDFRPDGNVLRRQTILGPGGAPLHVYYRSTQRRVREATDGTFCLTRDETGVAFGRRGNATGTPKPVDAAVLEAATVVVRPWWLAGPKDGLFRPLTALATDATGAPATEIRVCREEASAAINGTVFASGRTRATRPPPYGRLEPLPTDDAYATANAGKPIACDGGFAYARSADCGCGPNLERCLPAAGPDVESAGFEAIGTTELGLDRPLPLPGRTTQSAWQRFWWAEEAKQYLEWLAREDRDFREVLTGKATVVNGPLTQFYRHHASASCCGTAASLGHVVAEPLVDPAALPKLDPTAASVWKVVDDRGPRAAGILTMPIFLTKYGTRRSRAHAVYSVFECKEFVAEGVSLEPSTEPDLAKRSGCATCHAALEPMAAHFARIVESDWTWLPRSTFPIDLPACRSDDPKTSSRACRTFYEPAFTTASRTALRGAWGSASNVEAGPAGLAAKVVAGPSFATCVVDTVASSFLGRSLGDDDDAMRRRLLAVFVDGGFRLRSLVRALVREPAYANANDLAPGAITE